MERMAASRQGPRGLRATGVVLAPTAGPTVMRGKRCAGAGFSGGFIKNGTRLPATAAQMIARFGDMRMRRIPRDFIQCAPPGLLPDFTMFPFCNPAGGCAVAPQHRIVATGFRPAKRQQHRTGNCMS
jgi:hypothetical protein